LEAEKLGGAVVVKVVAVAQLLNIPTSHHLQLSAVKGKSNVQIKKITARRI